MHSKPVILSKPKVLLLAGIGTFLELYDYTLFVILLPFFASQIFPSNHALLYGYMTFAISFLSAPIGSLLWGWIGDKYGRLNLLRSSIFFMAIPSVCISMLPTYNDVGIFSPILVIVLRIFQGISASGEVQGAKVFMMEHFGRKNYGMACGSLSAAASFGVMLAMGMGFLCAAYSGNENFWRFPFALGGLLAVVGAVIRRYLTEPTAARLDKNSKFSDIIKILKTNLPSTKIAIALASMVGIFSYFMHGFLNQFVKSLGHSQQDVYIYAVMGLFVSAIGAITAGIIVDSNLKIIYSLRHCLKLFILFTPLLYLLLLSDDPIGIAAAYCGFGLLLGSYATLSTLCINVLFSSDKRCRSALFTYAIGVAIFGGLTPISFTLLSDVNQLLPALVMVIAGTIVLTYFKTNIKHVNIY